MKKIGLLFAALFLLFLAAPTTASACICTKEYRPVCGTNGKTYGNACMAKCSKAIVKCAGKCPCKKPCPVFRLKKPAPGCKYIWILRNGCKYPKLICKARKPFCTKARCKLCSKPCLFKKAACYRRAKAFNLAGLKRVRSMCQRIRIKSGLWKCLCTWASRKASDAVVLRGMRACYFRSCAQLRCCKIAAKLCIPNVGRPGCRKLICSARCK